MEPTRRPQPGQELLGVVAACDAADGDRPMLLRVATDALKEAEHGTHIDVVCMALAEAGGGPAERLTASYRHPALDATVPVGVPLREMLTALGDDDCDLRAAAAAVVRFESCHHLGLVWKVAHRLAPLYDVPARQLIADGWHGLLLALYRYDPRRWEFSTYAVRRMVGAIRDGLRADSPVPKRLTTLARAAARVEDELTASLNRSPTQEEFLEALGELGQYAPLLPRLASALPLPHMPMEGTPLRRDLVDPVSAEAGALDRLRREDINAALAALPPQQRSAVKACFLESRALSAKRRASLGTKSVLSAAEQGLTVLRADPAVAGWR